jgi:trimethylamine--corrinoid protein Co-methyltransferase
MGKFVLRFLSDEEVKRIREEAIKILEDVGVEISHDEAKKMLEDAGAKVDHATNLVHIPAQLAEECLKRIPKKAVLAGREPDKDIILEVGSGREYTRTMTGGEYYIDLNDGKYRKATLSDAKDWAVVVDGMEDIDICTLPYYYDANLNMSARDVHGLEIMLENTGKHILVDSYGKQNVEYMIKLGIAERGSKEELKRRPRFSLMIGPVPPLSYHANSIDMMFLAGEYGIPIELDPMPIAGAGGPVTLAGNTLFMIAEHLAGVVLCELAHPGSPVIFTPRPVFMDMHSGEVIESAIENAMMSAAAAQVAREGFGWHTDIFALTGDSPVSDGQSMIERSFNTAFTALAGADILAGFGSIEVTITLDIVSLAIDSEIYNMAARGYRGIEVNDDTLGLEAIRRVGAGAGKSFLGDEHTRRYFKTEYYKPKVFTYARRKAWESEGGKDLYERARERVKTILREHKPTPLDKAVEKELRVIVESAEREIKGMSTA